MDKDKPLDTPSEAVSVLSTLPKHESQVASAVPQITNPKTLEGVRSKYFMFELVDFSTVNCWRRSFLARPPVQAKMNINFILNDDNVDQKASGEVIKSLEKGVGLDPVGERAQNKAKLDVFRTVAPNPDLKFEFDNVFKRMKSISDVQLL